MSFMFALWIYSVYLQRVVVCLVPGVGAGNSLCVDVVTERLSTMIDSCPHIDLQIQNDLESEPLHSGLQDFFTVRTNVDSSKTT